MVARRALALAALTCGALGAFPVVAQDRHIVVASTTSTEQSGLFGHVLPMFMAATGIEVRGVARGAGPALDLARRGDADVVFVHDTPAEEKFVAEGFGLARRPVMYNDFVVVGPAADPARVAGGADAPAALAAIRRAEAPFVSRGDRSGTHMAEIRLWELAGVDLAASRGRWYRETGSGMGPALNTASAMDAYVLTDRGTWIAFRNRGDLRILVEGDRRLFNQYGVIIVKPARHPHVRLDDARRFADWLVGLDGQRAIAGYRIDGQQLFFPNARPGS